MPKQSDEMLENTGSEDGRDVQAAVSRSAREVNSYDSSNDVSDNNNYLTKGAYQPSENNRGSLLRVVSESLDNSLETRYTPESGTFNQAELGPGHGQVINTDSIITRDTYHVRGTANFGELGTGHGEIIGPGTNPVEEDYDDSFKVIPLTKPKVNV